VLTFRTLKWVNFHKTKDHWRTRRKLQVVVVVRMKVQEEEEEAAGGGRRRKRRQTEVRTEARTKTNGD